MPNPYVILAAFGATIGLAVASFGIGHHIEYLELVAYQKTQAAAAEKQVADNKTALVKQQQADQAAMDKINQDHGVQLNEITQRRDALLTANRNLTQRLWVSTSSGKQPSGVPQVGASGPDDAQSGRAALSYGSSKFFYDEFAQADVDTATIAALQQIVAHDREVCNGSLPGAAAAK
jgi:hypothetical protein